MSRSSMPARASLALCGAALSLSLGVLAGSPASGQSPVPGSVPVGTVTAFAGVTTPSGWLLADGQAVSRVVYAELFATIGTTYGAGDGINTFNLPDLRGRVPVGPDGLAARLSANDLIGQAGGEEKHALTTGELPSHNHSDGTLGTSTGGDHAHGDGSLTTSTAGAHAHGPGSGGWFLQWQNFATGWGFGDGAHQIQINQSTTTAGNHTHDVVGTTANAGSHAHDVSGSTGSTGSNAAHNVMQPYQILNYIIRAQSAP